MPQPQSPHAVPAPVRAIRLTRYGGPEDLELSTIDLAEPAEAQVVVAIVAASVNAVDWHRMRGEPYLVRASDGVQRPRDPRLGADFAGRVVSVGSGVANLAPGDEVFGMTMGTFAERAVVPAEGVVPKPPGVSFEEAAAVPVAAITALQGLRDRGRLQAGHSVLINGASGGVGTFAVQIAKALGAEVTAVCSTPNLELTRSIGADSVIDYTRQDATRSGRRFDVILEAAGTGSLLAWRRVLARGGRLVICGAPRGNWVAPVARTVWGAALSRVGKRAFVPFLAHRTPEDLATLAGMLESGAIRPVIERTYPFEQIRDAIAHVEAGHTRGKVVVRVSENAEASDGAIGVDR
jgi:NADPH:quinone reductase-like Zn-dependent oxidoreductase